MRSVRRSRSRKGEQRSFDPAPSPRLVRRPSGAPKAVKILPKSLDEAFSHLSGGRRTLDLFKRPPTTKAAADAALKLLFPGIP